MPPDPERAAETAAWFARAASDLRAADVGLAARPPLLDHVALSAQQAAEKAVKGFLAWHDQPFRKTHNLVELGEAAARITATSAARRACSCRLSTWSLRWRSVHLDDRPPGLPRPRS
jgi:HEPN domain-containing protein